MSIHKEDPRKEPSSAARHARQVSRAGRYTRFAVVGVAGAATVAALLAAAGTASASKATAATNGGFEKGLAGWRTDAKSASITGVSHSGGKAVALVSGADRRVALRDRPNIVRSTKAASTYTATAWVKGTKGTTAILRVREKNAKNVVVDTVKTKTTLAGTGWTKLVATVRPAAGRELAVAIVGVTSKAGQSVVVDDVAVTRAASTTPATSTGSKAPAKTESTKTTATKNAASSSSSGSTLFGLSLHAQPSESTSAAISRHSKQTGQPDIYRVFYPGVPVSWPGAAGQVGRPVNVSFKMEPKTVLTGKYDSQLKTWFSKAPTDRKIYWTYYHEPEDNIASKKFTAAQYRDAWKRIAKIADSTGKSNLKATLVLMSWSLKSGSHRNWKDYYPGSDVIDVLGWDAYNDAAKPSSKNRRYDDPANIFGICATVSKAAGKPFGFSEWGSLKLPGDSGSKRAQWIADSIAYQKKVGATFSTYFDSYIKGADFRLQDRASQQAMAAAF